MLCFALYRINNLHSEPLTRVMVCHDDFEVESTVPCFMSGLSKTVSINNFIRQCELSQVMTRIMLFQGQQGHANFYDRGRNVGADEIIQVVSFHSEVAAFREDVNFSLNVSPQIAAERYYMPCQLSRIISE